MDATALPDALRTRIDALLSARRRVVLGLAGAPGSGKSTLAALVVQAFPGLAVNVPMDGFHLANAELVRLGRAARKGAPDTFDAGGFIALLRRLRDPDETGIVYAPAFHREIEEPVAGEIAVPPAARLIVTEGNYLLMDGAWAATRTLLDESWFVATDEATRGAWLLARHMRYGRSAEDAAAWIAQTDEPNAVLIAATRSKADFEVIWPY